MHVRKVLMSADVYLNLGGNTDNMFALNQGKLGLGRFLSSLQRVL